MKRIYLDHAAATPVAKEVIRAMEPFWNVEFGNPSSIHHEGVVANTALAGARQSIAHELGVHTDEVMFTGSATESCNLALVGAVDAWQKEHPELTPHIIVSAIEHDAVLSIARLLESRGVQFSIIPVGQGGFIDMEELKKAIRMETVIISVMYANNEIGIIQPIREITRMVREWKKTHRGTSRDVRAKGDALYPLVHTDACQATNYLELNIPHLGVDLLTINASKIYGPKGVACLVVRRDIPIHPMIVGGGHERGLRAGTENVPLIVGFAEALRRTAEIRNEESARLTVLRDLLIVKLSEITGVSINGSLTERLPNNINFSVRESDHEFLTIAFDARGIAVSTKSACNESDAEHSHVLEALVAGGATGGTSGIRISMGRDTTRDDVEAFLRIFMEIMETLISSRETTH